MGKKYDIIWHECLDSTNDEALRHLYSLDNMSVIAAECQTAGRGQRGNAWESAPGDNLTFTVVMKFGDGALPALQASMQFLISEVTALAVSSFLEENGIRTLVKWPNDIYSGDRKICGILIENRVRGEMLSSSVCGIGLNLNQTTFPPDIPNPVSMKLETGKNFDSKASLRRLMDIFSELLGTALSPGGHEKTESLYLSHLYRKDSLHRFIDCTSGTTFEGIIRGISPAACLLVEIPDYGLRAFSFKEIQYII
ncbi:MAG: biotin--[acetyl-CoA-carboxylase] ligase [Bacteroidetes bacterium]|uniref:Biotin--[acetyl-CoA-carboxylase] ligase n=1 Tax=Candidatus Cryptobacteroides merdavium TaxID=2840769 RepID=A0A9D9ED07_9BACT|nr:biotin--[acetyl-CoA-carboxylase] ligase [Candidatus Cryptobacteroides merdavium]